MYPAAIRRSRCSSGIVRCIGLVPTSFKEANSSLVSSTLRGEKDRNWDRSRAIPSNMYRGLVIIKPTHSARPQFLLTYCFRAVDFHLSSRLGSSRSEQRPRASSEPRASNACRSSRPSSTWSRRSRICRCRRDAGRDESGRSALPAVLRPRSLCRT
jgi:hypothetical protein